MTTLYFWEVVCIGTVTHTKNYGQGIRRTVHSKQLIKYIDIEENQVLKAEIDYQKD